MRGHLPGEVPCVGHLPGEVPCVGHLPGEVPARGGTRPGSVHASAMSSEHRPGPDPAPERLPPPRSIARAPPSRRLVLAHMWEGWLPHLKGSITAGAEWGRCRGANLPVS